MKLRSKLFYSYLFFVLVYSGFTLLPAPSQATLLQYQVSPFTLRIIYLTLIALIAAIWYVGFYSYAKLHAYTQLIHKNKDGKQAAKLTKGLFVLVMWLPVTFVISAVLNFIAARHLGLVPAVTIINNYLSLLFPLMGFVFISMGARGLSELVRGRPTYRAINIMVILLIYIGLVYYRLVMSTAHRSSVYHAPIWVILTTIIAPYIFMWFLGIQAAYEIFRYRRKVAGVVYKKSWGLLALGLGWLITMSIGLQYLTTLSARLDRLSIYWLLVILYSILLILAVGFVLIALGARKLQKIEEV